MNSSAALTGSHLRTYTTIFQHPVSHNLEWHDVYALLRQLGQVDETSNGSLKVTRNGQVLFLPPSRTKEISETGEVLGLRHFIERSETAALGRDGAEAHWLLVINHHEARIFRAEMRGAIPERIMPHAPEDNFRHEHHSQYFSNGQEKPEPNSFFTPVARALSVPGQILIFGCGTGMGSEMEQFTAWAKFRHPELAKRIVGALVVDEHHLTDAQLLAKAREFYAHHRAA